MSNAAINSAALAISSGLNFAAVFFWTRLLEPRAFGLYALVSAAALLLNAIVFEWLRLAGARTLYDSTEATAIHPARANALFAIYGGTSVAFLTVAAMLGALGIGFADVSADWWPVMAAFALTEGGLAIVNTISRVRLNAWQFFRSMVLRSVASLGLGLLFVVGFRMGAFGALLGIVLAQAMVALGSVALDPLWRTIRPLRATRVEIAAALRLGYPLIASCGLAYAASVTDRFLIGATLGAQAVGYYAAPVDLLQKTLVFLMMAINLTAYPTLVRAYEDHGAEAASNVLDRNLQLQLGLGVPAAVGLVVLATGIANLMLGPAFRAEGSRLLPLIGIAALLRCLVSFHLMMVFQVKRQMALMIVPPLVTLVVLVPAGLIGIRLAGLPGMAMAAVAAQVACYGISAIFARRMLPIRIVSHDTVKIVLAGVGMGLFLVPFAHHDTPVATLALVAAGGLVYGLLLVLFRVEPVLTLLRRRPVG